MSWADLGVPEPGDDAPDSPDSPAATPKEPRAPRPPKPPKEPREPKPPREPREPKEPKPPKEPRSDGGNGGSRTPLVLGIIAGILLVAVVVVLAIALTRTTPAATPGQTPAASTAPAEETPSASATPAPDAVSAPVALDFSGTGFTLVDDKDRTVFTFGWRDDTADAVAALTEAFGAAPTQRVEPGDGSHYPDYTVYQWDGFMLFDMVESPGGTLRADYAQPTYVLFSRNEVGGIALKAEHGIAIGSTVADVRAAQPDQEIPRGNVGAIRFVFDQARSSTADPLQYSMFASTDGAVVTAILYYFSSDL